MFSISELYHYRLQEALNRGDSVVMDWLKHEEARRLTFTHWPGRRHLIPCLAFAGFYYTGEADEVQCVFCLGRISGWTKDSIPWDRHGQEMPNCPFMRDQPSSGNKKCISDKELDHCCRCWHPAYRQKHKVLQKPTQHEIKTKALYYLIALIALGNYVGLPIPSVTAEDSQVSSLGELPDNILRLNLWKGMVGILTNPVLIPEQYSTSIWRIELKECQAAHDNLMSLLDYWSLKFTTGTKKRDIDQLKSDLNQAQTENILKQYPEGQGRTPQTWCPNTQPISFTETTCGKLKEHAQSLQLIAETSVDQTTISAAALLVNELRYILQAITHDLKVMEEGDLPVSLQPLIDSKCAAVFHECAEPIVQSIQELSIYGKVLSIKRINQSEVINNSSGGSISNSNDNNTLQFEVTMPCITAGTVYGHYDLYPLPYEDKHGQVKRLNLKSPTKVIINMRKEEGLITINNVSESKLNCGYEPPFITPLCSRRTITESSTFDPQGNAIRVTAKTQTETEGVVTYDLGGSKYLIATPQTVTASLICGINETKSFAMQGHYIATIHDNCDLNIAHNNHNEGVKLEGYQEPAEISRLNSVRKLLPVLLTSFVGNHKMSENESWEEFLNFISQYWGVAFIPTALIPLCIISVMGMKQLLSKKKKSSKKKPSRHSHRGARTREYIFRAARPQQ